MWFGRASTLPGGVDKVESEGDRRQGGRQADSCDRQTQGIMAVYTSYVNLPNPSISEMNASFPRQ